LFHPDVILANDRRQDYKAGDAQGGQSSGQRLAPGGPESGAQPQCLGSQSPPPAGAAGSSESDHRPGQKLARLIYRGLEFGSQYVDKGMAYYEMKYRQHQVKWLTKQTAALNLQLIPLTQVTD
jgi:hypothetical protein